MQAGDYASLWAWEPVTASDVADVVRDLQAPWWIAGGFALDLLLVRETRRHDDLDIAVLRRDQGVLAEYLREWDLYYATPDHALEPWDGRPLTRPIEGIWARREPAAPGFCEFLLNESEGGSWLHRGNGAIRRDLADIGLRTDNDVPFLAPEVVLLYKAEHHTPKNESDFRLAPSAYGLVGARLASGSTQPRRSRSSLVGPPS
jgi:hypothetical protein